MFPTPFFSSENKDNKRYKKNRKWPHDKFTSPSNLPLGCSLPRSFARVREKPGEIPYEYESQGKTRKKRHTNRKEKKIIHEKLSGRYARAISQTLRTLSPFLLHNASPSNFSQAIRVRHGFSSSRSCLFPSNFVAILGGQALRKT